MMKEYKRMSKEERERVEAIMIAAKDDPIDYSDMPKREASHWSKSATARFFEMKKRSEEKFRAEFEDAVREARDKFAGMVAYLLLDINAEVPLVKLNKLLFYCDFAHYKIHKQPISGIPYIHLPQGPVPAGEDSYSLFFDMRREKIINIREQEQGDSNAMFFSPGKKAKEFVKYLSDDDKKIIGEIVSKLGDKEGNYLSKLSHDEEGYQETTDGEIIYYSVFADSLKI